MLVRLALVCVMVFPVDAMAFSTATGKDVIEHGGGCRKSSPPGQCCHMQRSTGTVHCH